MLADAPVAYYRLDDSGSTMADTTSNALNGSYGSAVVRNRPGLIASNSNAAAGFPGGAYSATGIATVPKNATLQPAAVSIECWVNETTANSGGFIDLVSYGPQSGGQAWAVQITPTNTFSGYVDIGSTQLYIAGTTVLSTGTAYQAVLTYDGTTARLFVNGALEGTANGAGSVNYANVGTYGLAIGAGQSTSRNVFNGTIDDVSVYGSALAPARAGAHYAAATTIPTSTGDPYANAVMANSPAAYYRLDDASAALVDATTNHLNGTYGGSVTRHATGLITGTSDYAATFGGGAASTATEATVPQNTLLQPTAAVTAEAWIKETTAATGFIDLVSYGDQSGQGYSLQVTNTNHASFWLNLSGGTTVYAGGGTALASGRIYHLVGTYDGTTAKIYVNGSLDGSTAQSGTISYTGIGTYGLSIGGGQHTGRGTLAGTIDEVAVYPAALTAAQISAHHNAGAAASPAGPTHVANWLYGCDADTGGCVSYPGQNIGIDDGWMASHVDWLEVGYNPSDSGDTTSANLAANGAKHLVVYIDPNITYTCYIPTGYSTTSNDFPEDGSNCGGQVASFLHAQNGSYAHAYLHNGNNGNRIFNHAYATWPGQMGEPLNLGDADVQAAFAAATARNPYATDIFEDDAGGSYNCIADWNARCVATSSQGTTSYAPPLCDYTNGGWCYVFGETAVEWDTASNPAQKYATDAVNLANKSAHNIIGNNGVGTDSYSLQWLAASRVKGAMAEGAWSMTSNTLAWIDIADQILDYHKRGKYVVEESTDAGQLYFQLASHWIVYDPLYSIEALFEVNPATASAGTNDTTFPEETVVPSGPRVAAPTNNDVTVFQTATSGLFVREYQACYQAGVSIGRCAAVANTTGSSQTVTGLTQSYGHRLVPNTSKTWAAGGTAQWSTSVPTSVGANTGLILAL